MLGLSPPASCPRHLLPGGWDWHSPGLHLARTTCPSGHFTSQGEQASGLPGTSAGRFHQGPQEGQPWPVFEWHGSKKMGFREKKNVKCLFVS